MPLRAFLAAAAAVVSVTTFGWYSVDFFSKENQPATDMLIIERAETPAAQAQGLSGRKDIPENFGMLFVFPVAETRTFWMKDMLVPIDIIWLDDAGRIIGIEASVSPDTYPAVFHSPVAVRYVLEMRAGSVAARGWTIGTHVPIDL